MIWSELTVGVPLLAVALSSEIHEPAAMFNTLFTVGLARVGVLSVGLPAITTVPVPVVLTGVPKPPLPLLISSCPLTPGTVDPPPPPHPVQLPLTVRFATVVV